MTFLNLTQHAASHGQTSEGLQDLPESTQQSLRGLLTFSEIPREGELAERAEAVAALAADHGATRAMIGGMPALMGPLEAALKDRGIAPMYAFSVRESVETTDSDGSVVKRNIFKHAGFYPAA